MNKELNISEEEELKIWRKYKNLRGETEKVFLLRKYFPLVKYVAGKIVPTVPSNIDFNDLIGFGNFGLLDAIDKFDPNKGVKFKTYGITRIRGQIYDELRSLDWIPRSVRQKYKFIEEVRMNYKEEKGEAISKADLCERVGMDSSQVNRISNMVTDSNIGSLDEFWTVKNDEDDIALIDTLKSSENSNPLVQIEQNEVKQIIAEEIKKLPEKEKKVLILYYYEELTLKEIGEVLSVTESRVSQIHSKAIRFIRSSLDSLKKNLV